VKDTSINTDGLNTQTTIVEIPYSGIEYFSSAAVITAGVTTPISVPVIVNVTKQLSTDLTVTIGINDAARTAYNTANPSSPQYNAMPSTAYSLPVTKGVIKAGQMLDTFYITFDPTKIDPTKNFMAAVAITDAQGQTISGNFGTYYLHTIGNPLAGPYTDTYNRWNNATGSGSPTTVANYAVTGLPDDPNTIEFQSGYGTQNGLPVRYVLTFTNTGGVLSNFAVKLNPDDVANSLQGAIGVLSYTDATIVSVDAVNKKFKFTYAVVNAAGSPRYFTDEYK